MEEYDEYGIEETESLAELADLDGANVPEFAGAEYDKKSAALEEVKEKEETALEATSGVEQAEKSAYNTENAQKASEQTAQSGEESVAASDTAKIFGVSEEVLQSPIRRSVRPSL